MENSGCTNYQEKKIKTFKDKVYTLKECDDLCILEGDECKEFIIGKGATN